MPYDLLLRCLPHVHSDQIVHIPRVLYHHRTAGSSDAHDTQRRHDTTTSGLRALRDYFAGQSYKPGSVVANRQLNENAIVVFRGT